MTKVRKCVNKTIYRENVKLVMTPAKETQTREIQKTVMVPYTEIVKQIKTVQKPVKKLEQQQRVDHRIETKVWWEEVSEEVRIPVPKPSCGCYKTNCGCVGQPGCGCCQPKCGCAPPKVQYATQIVTKKVPKAEEVKVPVLVPFMKEVEVMQDEHILHEVPVTKMKPKIVLETIEEVIPVYKEVPQVTKVPVIVEVCEDVLESDGVRPVVKQLTFEEVHQTHEGGIDDHNHAGYSRSSDVADPANPNMHSHTVHTNGLAFHVSGSD